MGSTEPAISTQTAEEKNPQMIIEARFMEEMEVKVYHVNLDAATFTLLR